MLYMCIKIVLMGLSKDHMRIIEIVNLAPAMLWLSNQYLLYTYDHDELQMTCHCLDSSLALVYVRVDNECATEDSLYASAEVGIKRDSRPQLTTAQFLSTTTVPHKTHISTTEHQDTHHD